MFVFFSRRGVSRRVCALAALVLMLGLAACGSTSTAASVSAPEKPVMAQDANGTSIVLPASAPQRIISLAPTSSEVLAALHLESKVLGVDSFTDYPSTMAAKPKVTDANGSPNVEQIVALHPDLVVEYGGFKQSDQKLLQAHVTLYDLPITNLATAVTEIRLMGQLTRTEPAANTLADSMQAKIDSIRQKAASAARHSVYMEVGYTPSPPYAFGGGSFGNDMIVDAGGSNIFASDTSGGGFPAVSDESIIKDNPQVIVLTEDPHYGGDPATVATRPGWASIAAVTNHHVYAIDPNLVERPGPRVVDGLQQLAHDLHPELFP